MAWWGYELELAWPHALALIGLTVIIVYLWRRAKQNYFLVSSRLQGISRGTGFPYGLVVALILFSIAASEPSITVYEHVEVSIANIDRVMDVPIALVVAVDTSKSMGYIDGGVPRMQMAKDFLAKLASHAGNFTIVLMKFSGRVELVYSGPPVNATAIIEGLAGGEKYSAIGDAIGAAVSYARASGLPTAVIVVTDGGWNYGSDPVQAALQAEEQGVPVVFVVVGSDARGFKLEEMLRASGIRVYRLDSFTYNVLDRLAEQVAKNARLEALKASGQDEIEIPVGRKSFSWPLGLTGAFLAALFLRARGV